MKEVDERLSKTRWMVGDHPTEADFLAWTFFAQFENYLLQLANFDDQIPFWSLYPNISGWFKDFGWLNNGAAISTTHPGSQNKFTEVLIQFRSCRVLCFQRTWTRYSENGPFTDFQ